MLFLLMYIAPRFKEEYIYTSTPPSGPSWPVLQWALPLLLPLILKHFNSLNAELNPDCRLLALFGAHHILHVSS